jgi:hypothetical protein
MLLHEGDGFKSSSKVGLLAQRADEYVVRVGVGGNRGVGGWDILERSEEGVKVSTFVARGEDGVECPGGLVLRGELVEGRDGVGRHGGAAVEADETRGERLGGGLEEALLRVEDGLDAILAAWMPSWRISRPRRLLAAGG